LAREGWPTRADPGQLLSANINLAVNLRNATPQGGTQDSHQCGRQRRAHPDAWTREGILVVQDDERVRKLTITRLNLIGHRVLEASYGPMALEILRGSDAWSTQELGSPVTIGYIFSPDR
jgi:hypothetical protein